MTHDYVKNGPAVPTTYADIDWDEWDRPHEGWTEKMLERLDEMNFVRIVIPKQSATHIGFLILEHQGRIRRVTQDKGSVTWERVAA